MQKPKDMELRTLNKRHAFGIKADVYGCLHWLDEHTLTYPVGRNVVIHNTSTNGQKFFLTSEKTEAITAIALSPNKKYIAIAESGENPQIQIVDTNTRKRRRVLNVSDLGSDRFVAVEFSADGRHLVTQGGAPQWNLLYWNWERSKPLAQVAVTRDQAVTSGRDAAVNVVTKVSINPKDPLHVVVSGAGLFRFYRYVDGMLKQSPGGLGKAQTQNFTTHSWVTDERIIVATDNAELLFIEDGEFRCPLAAAPADSHAIVTIEPTSKGFVCGGESGFVHIFEQTDDKELYRKVRSIVVDGGRSRDIPEDIAKRSVVRCFALTHGEDMLALATSTMQVYGVKFNQDWAKVDTPTFNSITQPFHAGPIVGLDTCVRKPLVATSSLDHTVRIWNIQDHTVEVIKPFTAEPGAIALHPSGLHILVCFQDKVKFMNLYGDGIVEFKVFVIRGVSEVKFSVGGQYFAVVYANTIQVYNTYTCELNGSLRANSQKVRALQWTSDSHYPTDTRLVSCTTDGMVMDWALRELRKENDHIDKRFQYHAVAADDKNTWVVGTPASSQADMKWKVKLREIERGNMHGDTVANDYEFPDIHLTTLCLASQHRLLFAGCTDGSIKLMTFPLQGGIHDPPILAHSGAVNRIAVSYDENHFFSVGQDGSFYMFDVKEDGRTAKRETMYADEILISKGDLEEKNNTTQSLKQAVDDLNLDMDYQEKRRGVQHDERVKEQTNLFQEDAEKQAQQFAAVWNAKLDQERAFAELKRELAEEHGNACATLERDKQAALQELEELCKERRQILERQRSEFALRLQNKDDDVEKDRREKEDKHLEMLAGLKDTLNKLQATVERNTATHGEMRSQLEMDTDAEIESVKKKYEDALHKEREKYLHMKGENAIMKKNYLTLTKEIDNRSAEVRALDNNKAKLTAQIRELNTKITQLTADIDERDMTIAEKEKKIYELKKKNQELEKHKFVLDHQIRQLKSQIEPRQMQIAREKEKIQAKDRELEQFHKNSLTLRQTIEELKKNITQQQGHIKTFLNRLKDFETYKGRVKTDIGELAQLVQDPIALRKGIEKVYHDHVVARNGRRQAPLEAELRLEFDTHTDYLSRTVESLKRKVNDDHSAHKNEVSNVMRDNLGLIREIHDLRKEIRGLRNSMQGPDGGATTAGSTAGPSASTGGPEKSVHTDPTASAALAKEIDANRAEIARMRSKIEELEKSITIRSQRPASRDKLLPPITQ